MRTAVGALGVIIVVIGAVLWTGETEGSVERLDGPDGPDGGAEVRVVEAAAEVVAVPRPRVHEALPLGQPGVALTVVLDRPCGTPERGAVEIRQLPDGWSERRQVSAEPCTWTGLGAGRYEVSAHSASWSYETSVVELDQALADVTVKLAGTPVNRISGLIVDAHSGEPVRAASIVVESRVLMGAVPVYLLPYEVAVTTEAGRFCLVGVPLSPEAQEVRVLVSVPEREVSSSGWMSLGSGPFFDGLVFAVEAWTGISGRVTSAAAPGGAHGAVVHVVDVERSLGPVRVDGGAFGYRGVALQPGDPDLVATSADGMFRVAVQPPREVRVTVFHPGLQLWRSEPLSMPAAGAEHWLEVTLQRGGRIEGRVLHAGADGSSAMKVEIKPLDQPDALVAARLEDVAEDASFSVGGLSAGDHRVMLYRAADREGPYMLTETEIVPVQENGTSMVIFGDEQPGGVAIHGRVRAPDSAVFSQFVAMLTALDDPDRPLRPPVFVAEDGTFEILGAPAGPALLFVVGEGAGGGRLALQVVTLDVGAERDSTEVMDLSTATTHLLCADGAARRLRIRAETASELVDVAVAHVLNGLRTSADGNLWLHGLPPGAYAVSDAAGAGEEVTFLVGSGAEEEQVVVVP